MTDGPGEQQQDQPARRGLTRRRLLAAGGGAAAGLAVGGGVGFAVGRDDDGGAKAAEAPGDAVLPVYGAHQSGIADTPQDRLVFAAFDVTTESKAVLADVLRQWTDAIVHMAAGVPVGPVAGHPLAPPADTGEAMGLPAAGLSVTVGFGPSLFDREGLGLAARRPKRLRPLGPLPGEELIPALSGGDICVQACANDPQVAFHAVRNLARIGRGVVVLRWTQLGFGRAAATSPDQETPRNLMGFKDGTNNIDTRDAKKMASFVWVGDEEPQAWMHGGSYLVTRRIRMRIESWDRANLDDQQVTIGRFKVSGSPLSGGSEHTPLALEKKGADGEPAIPDNAHVRLAAPEVNRGVEILRRGYNYTDGTDPASGQLDAGLFFIAFQKDPAQFVALQNRLGAGDALNEYILHTSSALFAVPTGFRRGEYVGQALFA
jgi:deferrochelatase/peroxidase EfeB